MGISRTAQYPNTASLHMDIEWSSLDSGYRDPPWNYCGVLYAYLSPDGRKVLNIGKAYRQSVRERLECASKDGFWSWATSQRINGVVVLVGEISTNVARFTDQMLCDLESLLIFALKPPGNIANTRTRNCSRPGMRVRCIGPEWPAAREFVDEPPRLQGGS